MFTAARPKYVTVHGGTNASKSGAISKRYADRSGAMQTFPAAPGSTWAASGWAATQTPDNMTSTETSYIEVQFLEATTNLVAPADDCTSPTMTTASPVNTWSQFKWWTIVVTTNLIAPDGTAFVRFLIRFYPTGRLSRRLLLLGRRAVDPDLKTRPGDHDSAAARSTPRVYGQTVTFSVVADGLTALTYIWQKDGWRLSPTPTPMA